jgi:hypothetical protein
MERAYWLSRKEASIANADQAIHSKARLVHMDLAERYALKASDASKFDSTAVAKI